jgi:hypothetical protein
MKKIVKKVSKIDTTKAEESKKKIKKTKEMKEVKAPMAPPKDSPVRSDSKCKRALAIALVRCVKANDNLAEYVVKTGIPYKASTMGADSPELLNKGEWSGQNYARWAVTNKNSYYVKNQSKVDAMREYVEGLTGNKMDTSLPEGMTFKPVKVKTKKTETKEEVSVPKKVKKIKKHSHSENTVTEEPVKKIVKKIKKISK